MTIEEEKAFTQARYSALTGHRETAEEKKKRIQEQEYMVFEFYHKLGAWGKGKRRH